MKKLLLIILLLPILGCRCYAEDVGEDTASLTEIERVEDGLQAEERSVSGELRIDGTYDAQGALGRLWERVLSSAREQLKSEIRFSSVLISIALLCSLASALSPGGRIAELIELAACCGGTILLAGGLESEIGQATESLQRLSDYAKVSLPAFFTTVAACGAAVSASVKYAAACFVMDLFMTLSQRLILPLIYAYLAVTVSGSLFENSILTAAARIIKWCAITAMTGVTSVFCLYISLSGLISGSADAAAVKAAKTVVAAGLPVVGRILSDSASSILAASAVIKNSAGVFCLIAVCAICAGPFAVLAVKVLIYKACSALAELSCGGRFAKLLSGIGGVFAMLLGMVGSYGVMLFLSFMSGIQMGTA